MNRFALPVVLLSLGLTGAGAPARADPSDAKPPPKASAFAPRHTGTRVYGSPIEPQILHSRKRKPATHRSSSPASASSSPAATPPQP